MREVGDTASSHQKATSVPKSYNRVLTDTNINQKKKKSEKNKLASLEQRTWEIQGRQAQGIPLGIGSTSTNLSSRTY